MTFGDYDPRDVSSTLTLAILASASATEKKINK